MLPCCHCAYKAEVPGSAHIQCLRADVSHPIPESKRIAQWFIFPFNYDPTWGPAECPGFATKRDPMLLRKQNALTDLISIMGRRL